MVYGVPVLRTLQMGAGVEIRENIATVYELITARPEAPKTWAGPEGSAAAFCAAAGFAVEIGFEHLLVAGALVGA